VSEILPSFSSGEEALGYAHQHRKGSSQQLELALLAFKEAARLFRTEGQRKQTMQASSWHLTLRGRLDEKGTKYEQELLQFLEEYQDLRNERGYLFCKLGFLMQISLRSKQEGNYTTATEVLLELADLAETHRDVFRGVSREQVAIWRTQAKMATLKNITDIDKRIQYYREAAELSLPPQGSDSALSHEMQAHRASSLSEIEKLLGFQCIRRGRNDLNGAIAHMEEAIKHAQTAKEIAPNKFSLQTHYLSYWLNVFSAREHVENGDFQEALSHLDEAITEANYFNERAIFPNYFANKSDLVQERLLVEAYIDFSEKRFTNAHTLLKTWLKAMKEDLQGSWKYANVAVRSVLTDVLSKELSPPSASHVKENIERASASVRLGTACRKIADFALLVASQAERRLLTNASLDTIVSECIQLFPLSSRTNYRVSLSFFKQEPYDELPAYFGEWIREAESLEGETLFQELEHGLKAYLAIICDYYDPKREALVKKGVQVKPLPEDFQRDFIKMDVPGLAMAVIHLLKSIGKMPKGRPRLVNEFQQWLNHYLKLRAQFLINCKPEVAKQMLQLTKQELIGQTYIEMFPLVIHVHLAHSSDDVLEYRAHVLWQRPEAEEMILQGGMILEVGKYYYLKPHWKNFYHGIQDTDHHTFEAYRSSLFEACVINEYQRLRERRRIRGLQWRYFEFPSKIQAFEEIVSDPQSEHEIERFLLKNEWMLSPYYTKLEVQKRVQEDYRLDFFCTRCDQRHDIWEIKLPSETLFARDLTKTQKLNKALEQLREYQQVLQENASRIYWQTETRIHNPQGFLLIGREKEAPQRERLRRLNADLSGLQCTVLTYDELIRRAKGFVKTLRKPGLLPPASSS